MGSSRNATAPCFYCAGSRVVVTLVKVALVPTRTTLMARMRKKIAIMLVNVFSMDRNDGNLKILVVMVMMVLMMLF